MADPLDRPTEPSRLTWSGGDTALARRVARPVLRFVRVEAAGGAVLLLATAVALAWASSPWRAAYARVFHTEVALVVGRWSLRGDLTHWIDDGLMVAFFLVVGLEIKRELAVGELRDRRAAVLPAAAALGGMVVPAALYLAVNRGGPGGRGWGIPMATDIAFALGVLALLGRRVPGPLKVFLLTLAVVDDIGAIVVIAVFYAGTIGWWWLLGGAIVVAVVLLARRAGVRHLAAYVALGAVLWLCLYQSGVHATLAGVVMGLLAPARPLVGDLAPDDVAGSLDAAGDRSARAIGPTRLLVRESVSPAERVAHALHPWTAFVVVPLFALANAGIEVSADALTSPSAVTTGVVVGLVVGKVVGILAFAWLAVRVGAGVLPAGVRWVQLLGVAALGGIGFTVSLFVAGLAFPGSRALAGDAKVGILVASIVAAVLGAAVLAATGDVSPEGGSAPASADRPGPRRRSGG
ncbi:Na+/H+ antiporter NhaA [Aquihabitans sp. G128]|uniref:Na+/H+ antiporter NhaA n=1 Tax=Aquihabitans sp. G128 TaxID=2849779 RepID=UPI001C23B264|nr:Na+/H+ antiporter NhaA [Aquihabitans sp. G128]QXC60109.1 Na+/H+ antiporter NhaA [Aquihabitans sp. G128]